MKAHETEAYKTLKKLETKFDKRHSYLKQTTDIGANGATMFYYKCECGSSGSACATEPEAYDKFRDHCARYQTELLAVRMALGAF